MPHVSATKHSQDLDLTAFNLHENWWVRGCWLFAQYNPNITPIYGVPAQPVVCKEAIGPDPLARGCLAQARTLIVVSIFLAIVLI